MRMSMKILQRNNRYPFRLASNCIGPCGFRSYFNTRYCGKGNNLFVGRAGLKFVGEDSESSSDENAVSGVNLKFVRELVKRGIVLAATVCGVLVFGCRRVFAMEGVVNAGYGVIGQSILLLRNAWQKTLQVLQVFKDQGLILAALLGLSAFFYMAETSITTLWPWKSLSLCNHMAHFPPDFDMS
ncbi:DUF21 domain-containing protein At1g55930, chloroplastic-like [Fagus crenata]